MPTYEYECQDCGHYFEEFQSMSALPLSDCPACKKASLQRLIGKGAGIIFKGSGFYETDYKRQSSGYSESAKAEKTSGTPSSGSDTKSAAGSDSGKQAS